MCSNDTTAVESIDLENPRAQRALTECMTVLPEGGDLFTVVGEHGATYTVDARETGRCTCPDAEYNLKNGEACKHQLRTFVATGRRSVPAWIDRDAVDGLLGAHVEGSPRLVATDGGAVCDPGAQELTDEQTATDRPDDCECCPALASQGLPCWPCFRDGHETPVPDTIEEREE